MVLQPNVQHKSVPLLSVHVGPLPLASTASCNASESIHAPCPKPSVLHGTTLGNGSTATFPHTPVSPDSPLFFTARHAPKSASQVPQSGMKKDHLSTLGRFPITPVSPQHSFPLEKNPTDDHDHMLVVQGYQFTDTLRESAYFSANRTTMCNGTPPSPQDRPTYVRGAVNWQDNPSGTLPTPISAPPKGTGSLMTPIQAIDLTNWITRSYGLDPVAGGAFGNVWKCTYNDGFRHIAVAVKGFRFNVDKQTGKKLRREMGIWRRLNHPNVMEFMGIAFGFGLTIALVAPWAENGTLTDYLDKHWSMITGIKQLSMLDDIASGLSYLHSYPSNAIIHGDLTGSNVLILPNMTACIADFGLSSMLGELQAGMTYLAATAMHPGAVRWTAPELLESDDLQPTTLSDVYSLGSIMLQVLSGKVPWHEIKREATIIREIHEGHTPPYPLKSPLMDTFWPFISQCWSFSPVERPSAGKALEFIRRLRAGPHPNPPSPPSDTPSVTVALPASCSGPLQRPRLKIIT